jgi:hypothetical protein
VWAPQGGDGQMQVPRTQHNSGCRECGAGSVLGTPVATTGRATKKENHDSYRLCYVRGPEGIIVALAEQLS